MKLKVKYSVLFYTGKKGSKTQTFDCPFFEDIHYEGLRPELPATVYTAVQQADNWVGEQDRKQFMDDNDIQIIFDWEVISLIADAAEITQSATSTALATAAAKGTELVVKKKKLSNAEIVEVFATMLDDEKMKADFIAVYTKMKDTIKSFSYEKQIQIVLSGMSVAYASAMNVYDRLDEFDKKLKSEREQRTQKSISS